MQWLAAGLSSGVVESELLQVEFLAGPEPRDARGTRPQSNAFSSGSLESSKP